MIQKVAAGKPLSHLNSLKGFEETLRTHIRNKAIRN
jgi:hypothetical protein